MSRDNGPSAEEIKRAENMKLMLGYLKDRVDSHKKLRDFLESEISILRPKYVAMTAADEERGDLHFLIKVLDKKRHEDQLELSLYEVLERLAEASLVCRHCCGHGKQIREHHLHEPWTADGPFESQPDCIPCLGLGWKKPPLFRDPE